MRPGHEYVPNPKSTSEIGESYEDTGMAGLAARTAKSRSVLFRMRMRMMMMMMMMAEGESEEETAREWERGWGLGEFESLIT